MIPGSGTPTYLQTQLTSITTDPVLDRALAGSAISKFPMIKDSTDPKADLRKKLDVQVLPNTHWMRVALESTDPQEATEIVNAVVDAFNEITKSFGTGANRLLKTELEKYKKKLERRNRECEQTDLRKLRQEWKRAVPARHTSGRRREEADQGPQPAFNSLTLDQFRTTKDQLLQTEFQLLELEARFQSKQWQSCNRPRRGSSASGSPVLSNERDKQAAKGAD